MPESVLVRFKGQMQPGVTLRDLVHAIPLYAIKQGLLTVEKKGKKNIFSGRILEIEGLPDLKIEQAFELADASAERSAAGCTVALEQGAGDRVPELEHRAAQEHDCARAITTSARINSAYQEAMEAWLAKPAAAARPTRMPSTQP
jgi:aconitate hydratase 2 / 2-methylisocitrate dehydratase